jgi:hypothetical protein
MPWVLEPIGLVFLFTLQLIAACRPDVLTGSDFSRGRCANVVPEAVHNSLIELLIRSLSRALPELMDVFSRCHLPVDWVSTFYVHIRASVSTGWSTVSSPHMHMSGVRFQNCLLQSSLQDRYMTGLAQWG